MTEPMNVTPPLSFKSLTGNSKIAGVMGWPVGHSKSPRLHGYWLSLYGIDGTYIPLSVLPEGLGSALRALSVMGFKGANLTLPHKEAAMEFVDSLDPLAKRVGAINTVIVEDDGALRGLNTDVFGFTQNLVEAGFVLNTEQPVATVLGAGGASRAILVALQDMGFKKIRIVNRNRDKAEELCATAGGETLFTVHSWAEMDAALRDSSLLVNTTSLGMVGQPELPLDLDSLSPKAWVTDAVYAPLMTSLLLKAKKKGNRIVDGLGMLLHQARPGFSAWFGKYPEVTESLRQFVLNPQPEQETSHPIQTLDNAREL